MICAGWRAAGAALARAHADATVCRRAQELEFIIHADGRVEERVKGVKGIECTALTEEINKALGEVYETKPTNEMYEQKVEVEVEAEATVSEGWGTTSWGQSDGGSGSEW